MTSAIRSADGASSPRTGAADGVREADAAAFGDLVALKPSPLPYAGFMNAVRSAGGVGASASGNGSFWNTVGRLFEIGMQTGIVKLQERKAEITQSIVTPDVWSRLTPEAQQRLTEAVEASMARVPNGFGGGNGPEEHEVAVRRALDEALRQSAGPGGVGGLGASAGVSDNPPIAHAGPTSRKVKLDGPDRDYDIDVRRTSEDGRNVYKAHYRIGGTDYEVPIPNVHSLDQAERGARRMFLDRALPGLDPNAPASGAPATKPATPPAAARPEAPPAAGKPSAPEAPSRPDPVAPSTPARPPVDPGPSLDEMMRRSEAEAAQRLAERVRKVGAFQEAEAGLQKATEGVRHSPGLTPPPTKEKVQEFLDAFQLFQAAKKEYSRSQNVSMESLVSIHLGPAVGMLDELKKQGRVTQDPSGRLRALDPPKAEAPQGSTSSSTPPDRKDDIVPVTVGEPQPSTGPGTGTDADRKDDVDVAAFTRVTVAPNGSIAAAGTYFDPGDANTAPRNLVVNRLVHVEGLTPNTTSPVNSGHDAMHFITGFGLNPKGADRIPGGEAFGATALELGGAMTPEDQQRNLNGILIENIVDGAKEAMFNQLSSRELLNALPKEPKELRETAGRILTDLKKRTGYAIIQDGIVPGTDFHRQARQLVPENDPGAGLGRMEASPQVPGADRYAPKMDNVKFHDENFTRLLEDNPKVLNDLKANLVKYLEYAARAEMAYAETGRAPSMPPLELTLPPDSTEALMRTAIKGLDQLDAAYPGAEGIDELRRFYESVLETGRDGSPQISQAPPGPALA